MTLIIPTHAYQFTKWHNLGITTLKHAICAPNIFLKFSKNQINANFIYQTYSNFATIFDISYWHQVNSRKRFCKFCNGLFSRHKTGSSRLLNVASYWKSSNAKACAKKLSQILANNIDNGWREIRLRIYVRSSSFLGVSLCF